MRRRGCGMMWASIMDEIISQEPTLSVRRTLDAKHYILNRWNETHDTPIDESAVMLFLCDERCDGLTDEQRAFAKDGRATIYAKYRSAVFRLFLYREMLQSHQISGLEDFFRVLSTPDILQAAG